MPLQIHRLKRQTMKKNSHCELPSQALYSYLIQFNKEHKKEVLSRSVLLSLAKQRNHCCLVQPPIKGKTPVPSMYRHFCLVQLRHATIPQVLSINNHELFKFHQVRNCPIFLIYLSNSAVLNNTSLKSSIQEQQQQLLTLPLAALRRHKFC